LGENIEGGKPTEAHKLKISSELTTYWVNESGKHVEDKVTELKTAGQSLDPRDNAVLRFLGLLAGLVLVVLIIFN
jgi:hypothetical protein